MKTKHRRTRRDGKRNTRKRRRMRGGCGCSSSGGHGGTLGLDKLPMHNYYKYNTIVGGGKKREKSMRGGNFTSALGSLTGLTDAYNKFNLSQPTNAPYEQPIQGKYGGHNQVAA